MRYAILLMLILLPAGQVYAEAGKIYKWTDSEGNVHFGDAPPPGQGQELAPPKPVAVDPNLEQRRARRDKILDTLQEEREIKLEQERKAKEQAAERERRCILARDDLRRYQEAGTIYELDPQGNRRVLNNEEHTRTLEQAGQEVARWCE